MRKKVKAMNCKDAILQTLKGEMTAYAISKNTGYSYSTTHRYVKELKAEGKIIETRRDLSQIPLKVYYSIKKRI